MATIGFDKPHFAVITEDANGNETYGTPQVLAKGIDADLSVELLNAIIYADDGADIVINQFKQGTFTLNVNDLEAAVVAALTGAEVDSNGVIVHSTEDVAPPVAIGFRALKPNGKYRYFWLYRVTFAPLNDTFATKGDSITVQTPKLIGTVTRRHKVDTKGKHQWKTETTEGATGAVQSAIDGWFDAVYEPDYSGEAVSLSDLTIGSISLLPAFDADVTEYTAATSNATNTITATLNDNTAGAVITVNGNSLTNGGSATWETGENTVNITVTKGTSSKKYTVIVTKS